MMKVSLLILTASVILHSASGACKEESCRDVICEVTDHRTTATRFIPWLTEYSCTCQHSGKHWNLRFCGKRPHKEWIPGDATCIENGRRYVCGCVFQMFMYCPAGLPPRTTTLPPTTTVDPEFSGFPHGDFMIKHEASGLCVQNLLTYYPQLVTCNTGSLRQKWYNNGKQLINRDIPWESLKIDVKIKYHSVIIQGGRYAGGKIYGEQPVNSAKFEWEYKNKYLISMAAHHLYWVPVHKQAQRSTVGTVGITVGGMALEDATEEDLRQMKWLLIPV